MADSILNLFTKGIGPSSSHTVGVMRITYKACLEVENLGILNRVSRIQIELLGSLGATGVGHESDRACIYGLLGYMPESIPIHKARSNYEILQKRKTLSLLGKHTIPFDPQKDIQFKPQEHHPFHPNALRISFFDDCETILTCKDCFSIGGGAIVCENEAISKPNLAQLPYPYASMQELLAWCKQLQKPIHEVVFLNESALHEPKIIRDYLLNIATTMREVVARGCFTSGFLPITNLPRRAPSLFKKLCQDSPQNFPFAAMDWVSTWAMAVNEENACGGIIVTAPTNGAAGIIPATLSFLDIFFPLQTIKMQNERTINFLLTAGGIARLYQRNASISGADVGCQGEVGVACSMAAGALAFALGATPEQIENAAEIAMEHNLGLTCDPYKGLVQVPCIERNAMASAKAIHAARLALQGDGKHFVSLDSVIKTMLQTGKDMQSKYKETSQGGLAVNIVEC
jgi:L-serine dehydratase